MNKLVFVILFFSFNLAHALEVNDLVFKCESCERISSTDCARLFDGTKKIVRCDQLLTITLLSAAETRNLDTVHPDHLMRFLVKGKKDTKISTLAIRVLLLSEAGQELFFKNLPLLLAQYKKEIFRSLNFQENQQFLGVLLRDPLVLLKKHDDLRGKLISRYKGDVSAQIVSGLSISQPETSLSRLETFLSNNNSSSSDLINSFKSALSFCLERAKSSSVSNICPVKDSFPPPISSYLSRVEFNLALRSLGEFSGSLAIERLANSNYQTELTPASFPKLDANIGGLMGSPRLAEHLEKAQVRDFLFFVAERVRNPGKLLALLRGTPKNLLTAAEIKKLEQTKSLRHIYVVQILLATCIAGAVFLHLKRKALAVKAQQTPPEDYTETLQKLERLAKNPDEVRNYVASYFSIHPEFDHSTLNHAYRTRVKALHPDSAEGSIEKFSLLQRNYGLGKELLSLG